MIFVQLCHENSTSASYRRNSRQARIVSTAAPRSLKKDMFACKMRAEWLHPYPHVPRVHLILDYRRHHDDVGWWRGHKPSRGVDSSRVNPKFSNPIDAMHQHRLLIFVDIIVLTYLTYIFTGIWVLGCAWITCLEWISKP